MRSPKLGKEFKEFYGVLWQKSWKLTIILSIAIPASIYDEINEFAEGHGTVYMLWSLIQPIIKSIIKLGI